MWPIYGPSPRRTEADLQWIRTVEPTEPVLSLQEARDQIRASQPETSARVQRYINAATDAAEEALGRGLLTQTWQLTLPCWYDVLWLPMAAPLQNDPAAAGGSTAPIVQYYDVNGALQTLATTYYVVDTGSRPGRILRAADQSWPGLQSGRLGGRVLVTYVVGWTSADLIPERIKQGCRLYVGLCDADADGTDPNHERAVHAAANCWSDRVSVIWPEMHPRPYWYAWPA